MEIIQRKDWHRMVRNRQVDNGTFVVQIDENRTVEVTQRNNEEVKRVLTEWGYVSSVSERFGNVMYESVYSEGKGVVMYKILFRGDGVIPSTSYAYNFSTDEWWFNQITLDGNFIQN